jgi:acetyl esterase/lipase
MAGHRGVAVALIVDPEIADRLAAMIRAASDLTVPERGDALGLRTMIDQGLRASFSAVPDATDVRVQDHLLAGGAGTDLLVRAYVRELASRGPGVVYVHGGGRICGDIEIYDPLVRHYVSVTGAAFFAVAYRRAPEFTGTAAPEDCLAAVRWVHERSTELGIDPSRFAIMGDSGGGGIAAGTAILARDAGVPLAKQILIYPMLDDRTTAVVDPHLARLATWTYDNNFTGWHALLGASLGEPHVPPVLAPSRLDDLSGLPPAYIEIGELDIFRDESVDYAARLQRAGVSCELHVHPGAPHGYDWLAPESALTRRAMQRRIEVIAAL